MSDSTNVTVMNQLADDTSVGNVAHTPMEHVRDALTAQAKRSHSATVELTEQSLNGLLVIRANDARDLMSAALKEATGVALPHTLQSEESGDHCVRWMTPDEWLLTCPINAIFELENTLRAAVHGHVALVNVSGGYSVFTLSGANARNVLKKSCVYDVNPENFSQGKVVNTLLAKSQVTLRALDDDAYEIIVRRSFADYVWLWLQRAGKEFNIHLTMLDD